MQTPALVCLPNFCQKPGRPGVAVFPAPGLQKQKGGCSKVNYLYLPFAQVLPGERGAWYETFGIHCWELQNGRLSLRQSIPDISPNERFVRTLAGRFTGGQLEPVHFMDAVLDQLP